MEDREKWRVGPASTGSGAENRSRIVGWQVTACKARQSILVVEAKK